MNIRRKFLPIPLKFLPAKSKIRINFNCILFEVNIFVKKLEKQYLKKWEKQMRNDQQSEYKNTHVYMIKRYQHFIIKSKEKCLRSSSKGYWLRNRRSCKGCFHESSNEICETKEDLERLKKVWNRCRKSNESRKGHAGVSFSQLVGQFCVRKKQ